jgi:alpha-mannosidase
MDAWNKLLTWGLGGDQLRILDRKVEALLLAAERFDVIAATMGVAPSIRNLDQAWRNLLASQSHDVGLCEYSRWQGDRMAPLDRIEDRHNFTWGAIGYNHLDVAERHGRAVLDGATAHIVRQISAESGKQDQLTVYVFNPLAWERDDIALTGRIYPIQGEPKDIVVRHHSGRVVPSQIITSYKDGAGRLVVSELAFLAEKVPSVGYDTYHLELSPEVAKPPATDLRINERQLELENKFVKIELGASHGALVSLIDRQTGQEMLKPEKSPFPVFKGAPNQDYCLRSAFIRMKYGKQELAIPSFFDSSRSVAHDVAFGKQPSPSASADQPKSEICWIEKGPLRATVRARHDWPLLRFETHVTLCAGLPRVEVTSRVLSEIPPATDALDANGRFPIEIKEGYWLTFAPGFQPVSIIRDFPLAIEPTVRQAFHALTFVDLVAKDAGLLVLHPGTQYFKRDSHGIFANLLMREWESHWTGEYGWPRYAEYHHALLPHRGDISNAERMRAAREFSHKLITARGQPPGGNSPPRKSFVTLSPNNIQILALRKKDGPGSELRIVEVEGRRSGASVELALPIARCSETDLLGNKVAEVACDGSRLNFEIQPWRVRTFEII